MLPDPMKHDQSIEKQHPQSTRPDDESATVRQSRPTGVTILAVLHFVGGIGLLCLLPAMISQAGALQRAGQTVGIPGSAIIAGSAFLAVLSIAAGIGMWKGTRWGWWLGAFYYVYAIARNASALVTIVGLAEELSQQGGRGLPYYVVKHSARIGIHFLILLYFFKSNVIEFFGLTDISQGKAVAKFVGICGAISVVATILSLLSS